MSKRERFARDSIVTDLLRNQQPFLTHEEEIRLSGRIRAAINRGAIDREAEDRFVCSYLSMVVNIARMYSCLADLEDIVSAGIQGLIVGMRLFDVAHQVRFSTYGTYWIKNHIRTYLANCGYDTALRVPFHRWNALHRRHNRESRRQDEMQPFSVRGDITNRTVDMEDHELLHNAMECLNPVERCAVAIRFSLDCPKQTGIATWKTVGDQMGFSRETARKIVASALTKMREYTGRSLCS